MPEKIDIYRSYGQKLISLFVRLLFSRESYSLTELARMLGCSKQTVLRLLDDITTSYGVDLEERMEGKRKYVSIKQRSRTLPLTPLTEMELSVLQMCKDFTSHLLGQQLFEDATRALLKSQAFINQDDKKTSRHFGASRFGYIDYTPYSGIIRTLVEAMDLKRTCSITYKAIMENRSKTYYINPLKIFSHRDTIYLHAKLASSRNELDTEADFDPLLAIHRIKKVEMTDRSFKLPAKYDFEKIFNRNFGIMKGEPFKVAVEFKGWAAKYVSERIWSPDQKIKKIGEDKIILEFTASSEPEVISWLLWFGEEARLTKPERLAEEIIRTINSMKNNYL